MKNQAAFWLVGLALSTARAGGHAPPSGCLLPRHINVTGIQKRLTAAEALWRKRGPDAYRIDIDFQGVWAIHNFQLSVPRGQSGWLFIYPVSSSDPSDVRVTTPVPALVATYTVPGLFARVRSVLKSARGAGACGVLNVTFDPHDGHLRSLQNDSSGIIDDEFLLTTSVLTPEP